MPSKQERAAARRRQRKQKAARRSTSAAFGQPLMVVADYFPCEDGTWRARVAPDGLGPAEARGVDPHATFHDVLEMVEVLANDGWAVSTVHRLAGSTEDWTRLVIEHGFLPCVAGDHGPHHGITLT